MGQAVGRGLLGIAEVDPELRTAFQQALILGQVFRRGDDQDITDAGQHQRGDRVVNHRFVVDRQQLLGHAAGDGVQASAGAAGQDDPLHLLLQIFVQS